MYVLGYAVLILCSIRFLHHGHRLARRSVPDMVRWQLKRKKLTRVYAGTLILNKMGFAECYLLDAIKGTLKAFCTL